MKHALELRHRHIAQEPQGEERDAGGEPSRLHIPALETFQTLTRATFSRKKRSICESRLAILIFAEMTA